MNWDDFIKIVKKKYPKAKPEKVLNLVKAMSGGTESDYQVLRNSWSIDVVCCIYKKSGSPKDTKKRGITNIIRNWIISQDYKDSYNLLHPAKTYETLTTERHVKNCYDLWINKKGKELRKVLKSNKGKLPAYFRFPGNL